MPLYKVYHSYPITDEQRQALATSITNLHCETFTTPSFFVHIRFIPHDASDGNYFMAGRPRLINSNYIVGIVRTSPARSKSTFDALAAKIETAWYEAVHSQPFKGLDNDEHDTERKRLRMVTFTPMITIREGGMAIPEAGTEGTWLKEQLPFIKQMSEREGLDDFTEMLREIEEREDLKRLVSE
ncbi:putative cis-3-chloroacrylic acid dehalogenase [Aspergillus sclerotioniger CBS 115572]|uniref:Putative cis-3-chloroacrylic acid dehalogenase n=1 Tax=Aspergillus sclerotioniger CBS 115572 TaxID=1450535 RepID=A0A317VRE9_9EURO|nr:putative cis-3-chloroacrylic acid dehalogenase [Aspergillus sclerotioniger CBS 115572]PWY74480.1 putative cis-3-chloroacrylic acid dehalogenase [Aspergillus sclerotioniger CBS 115572]